MPSGFTELVAEQAALAWLESLGYAVLHGPDIAVGGTAPERSDLNYRDVILETRLRQALARLNPALPASALEDAFRKLTRADAPTLITRNRALHRMLVDGVNVEYRARRTGRSPGRRRGSSISTRPTTTTGSPSISSPSSSGSRRGGPTSCCSSTGCRSASSS